MKKKEICYGAENTRGSRESGVGRRTGRIVAGMEGPEPAQKRLPSTEEKKMLDEQLFKAISGKDACGVRRLLEAGADANAKNEGGWTVLMEAADKENAEAARMLIERADVNARTTMLWTALMSACHRHNIEIIRMLVDARADVNAKDDVGQDAIMITISAGCKPKPTTVIAPIVRVLVEAGANADSGKNAFGFSALDYARIRARSGNPEIEKIIAAAMATGQGN